MTLLGELVNVSLFAAVSKVLVGIVVSVEIVLLV